MVRTVTALRPERRDRVCVELDGVPWRTLPASAVVSAGLRVGGSLDRERARELRRAIRRSETLEVAGRALARRQRSTESLNVVLERRGVPESERAEALRTLERLGYLDDDRYATDRASALAARGYGDEAIRFTLLRDGIERDRIASALDALEPELERAHALADAVREPRRLAARLSTKGFSPDTIESVLAPLELD